MKCSCKDGEKSPQNRNKRPRGHIAHLSHIGQYSSYEHMQRFFSLLPLDYIARYTYLFCNTLTIIFISLKANNSNIHIWMFFCPFCIQVTSYLLYITFYRKHIEPKIKAKNRRLNRANILNRIDISMNRSTSNWCCYSLNILKSLWSDSAPVCYITGTWVVF
jgi:hypothetical protein